MSSAARAGVVTWLVAPISVALGVFLVGQQDGEAARWGRIWVLTNIEVLRPDEAGASGAGAAVAAPVGGPTV